MRKQRSKPIGPTMWCRECRYPLDGLSEARCPECGLDFDPSDKTTFRYKTPPGQCPVCALTPDPVFRPAGPANVVCRHCGTRLKRHPLATIWLVVPVLVWIAAFLSLIGSTSPLSHVVGIGSSWALPLFGIVVGCLLAVPACAATMCLLVLRSRYSIRQDQMDSRSAGGVNRG
jgi:hypothetical protein